MQLLEMSGEPLGPPVGEPAWCRVMALTAEGAQVCDRGCGISLRRAMRETRCIEFQCPFGVSNLAVRIGRGEEAPVLALGGRSFHSYSQFRAFVERAIEAGASLADLLGSSPEIDFPSPAAMRMDFTCMVSRLLDDAEGLPEDGAEEAPDVLADAHDMLMTYDETHGAEASGQPGWAALRRAQEALESVADPQRLQQLLVQEMRAMSGARKVSLFLADPAAGDLVLVHAVGLPELVKPGLRRSLGEGVMGRVFSAREPLVVENLGRSRGLLPSPHGHYESTSFACLPLVSGQDRLGVLNLTDRESGMPFTQADCEWLRTASQIGAGAARRLALSRRLSRVRRGSEARSDSLLGSPLFFNTRLDVEFQRARRYKRALSLVLLEVDMSRWPGRAADARVPELIARGVANVLGPSLRTFDQVMHYEAAAPELAGATVFGVLLPETPRSAARLVAERLQVAVHERFLSQVPHQSDADSALGTRAGVAEYPADVPGAQELREHAEANLLLGDRSEEPPAGYGAEGLPDVECFPGEEASP